MMFDKYQPRDFADLLDFASLPPIEAWDRSRTVGEAEWYGTTTFPDAMDLARKGWTSGAQRVEEMYRRMYGVVGEKVKRIDFEYGVSGSVVDVGRFCAGEPECFMEFSEQLVDGPGRVITVTVNMFVSGGIDEKTIFLRGAGILTLVEALEEAGYSVALQGRTYLANKSKTKTADFIFPIKRAGEAIEIDRLAFVFCHQAFSRRLMFSANERLKDFRIPMGCHGGSDRYYGSPVNNDTAPDDGTAIYLKGLVYAVEDFKSESAVTAWVLKQLAAQGVELQETK